MHRCVDLHSRAERRKASDAHRTHVQYDAVEIEEHPLPQFDIRAVVAEKWRLHPHCIAAGTKQFAQEAPPFILLCFTGSVEGLTEVSSTFTGSNQFGIQRVVQLSRKHFLPFVIHESYIPSRRYLLINPLLGSNIMPYGLDYPKRMASDRLRAG
jgi:hypothetical protein